jgi:glycosyltransferase involved in cell wall biosynthesis
MKKNPRLAWLSPYGPQSDIGAYTRALLPHFADTEGGAFDCDLFVNANGQTYDSPVPSMNIPVGRGFGEILSRYDAAFFNLGNNFQNHGGIVQALRSSPGIAVLHDFSYHHFFAHRCFEELRSPPAYARLLRDVYGTKGFNMALRSGVITKEATLYAPWDGENVSDYPLMDPIAGLAAAVVVHSRFMEERVAQIFKGPILRLFLPRDQKVAPSESDISRWQNVTADKERCQFTTFGHINRSKCLDTIILALGQSSALKARAQLVIAGRPDDKEYIREIESLVTKLGLTKQVTFEYSVTNDRLLAIKNDTDVFLNLRYPNTEGASGSLVEMMNAGRPVIAYRAGCYADVPEEAALLIERSNGLDAVICAMEGFMSDPDRRIRVGRTALAHLSKQDSANYVRALKKFVQDITGDLHRRSRLVAPARDGMGWKKDNVASADADWFVDLTRARRAFQQLERDRGVHSPEMFLTWPADDLTMLCTRVLLNVPVQLGFPELFADYMQRQGRWAFYKLISKARQYQYVCEHREITNEDVENFGERIADVAFWDIATRLQPETFVQILYLAVLERESATNEGTSWVRRIRQGQPASAILLEFLRSAEYRQNFADDFMADVEDWARREGAIRDVSKSPMRAQIVWPTDACIRFNEDNPTTQSLLGQFWHRRDAQGRWSNGRTGDLRFRMPEGSAERGATLTLQLRVAGTRMTGQRKLAAHCGRTELASITVRNDNPLSWKVPIPSSIHSKDGINLLLIADRDFSPASTGQSADRRALGIMLIEAKLSLGDAEELVVAK